MGYAVYILYSEKDKNLYTGCASNLDKRKKKHDSGNVRSTCNRRPLILIHAEEFEDKIAAFKRERFLKSLWGAREKKKILKEYLEKKKG